MLCNRGFRQLLGLKMQGGFSDQFCVDSFPGTWEDEPGYWATFCVSSAVAVEVQSC